MKKKSSYRWLIWIILAVVLIGVALMHILPPYIDRWKSARDYDKLAEEYVNDESEPDDGVWMGGVLLLDVCEYFLLVHVGSLLFLIMNG